MKDISKRLDKLEQSLKASKPCTMTVTLKDGTVESADPVTVWEYFKNRELRKQVVSITADQEGYVEIAGVVEALCR